MPPPPNQPNSFWASWAARPRPLIRRINKVAFTHSRLSQWHGAKTIGQTYWRYLRIHPFVSLALDTKVFPILSSDCRCVAPLLSLPGETRRRPDARMGRRSTTNTSKSTDPEECIDCGACVPVCPIGHFCPGGSAGEMEALCTNQCGSLGA
jgi:NAD-dependent dihydropyrimidine dehydrogenase PreA subunit